MRRDCDDGLLRGGRRGKYRRDVFSSAQMDALTSICDTVLPPLDHFDCFDKSTTKSTHFFWKASASQFSIPDQVHYTTLHSPLSFSIIAFLVHMCKQIDNRLHDI